jgi:hypothetical protein
MQFSSSSSTFYSNNKDENKKNKKKILLKLGENDSKKYIIKNKEALYDYNKLLKKMKDPNFMNGKYNNYQETKDIFNIQYNTPNFKKNPKQIINSYNIELIGENFEKKIKYKSRILGVDEGLIELPKVFSDPNINLFKTTVQTEDKKKKKNQSRNKIMQENSKENTKSKKAFSFDKIIEKEKKNKINKIKNKNKDLIEEEPNKIEKYQNSIQMINEIKKLDSWDMRHAYKGIRRYQTHGTMRHILSSLGQGNMRWLLDIKNDPQKLKIISRNNYLKDFFNKIDQNQNAIFMQSLNIQKEEFNFDVFEKGNFNHEKDEILRKKRENQIDYYREAIKEKIKVEDILKNDLANIAQGIYDAKIEKKKLIVQLYDESLKINEIHKKKIKLKEEFDEKMEEIKNDLLIDNNNTIVTPRKKNDKGKNLSMRKEQLLKRNEAIIKQKELKQNIEENFEELDNERDEVEFNIEEINKEINQMKEEIKRGKMRLNQRIQAMRQYYFDILKHGIDVRRNGLVWVIVQLISLKSFIEKSHFPIFLNDLQIDYLLTISYKQYDINELIKLFQILKEKQKSFREDFIKQEKINKEKEKKKLIEKRQSIRKSGGDFTEFIEEIAKQYENVINICLNENKEEKYINEISEKLKKDILNIYKEDEEEENSNEKKEVNELYFLPGSLAEFFNKNQKFRIYFDDIVFLNSEIIKKEHELKELKEKELKNFKAKLKEEKNKRNSIENQLIFSALFGNGISV